MEMVVKVKSYQYCLPDLPASNLYLDLSVEDKGTFVVSALEDLFPGVGLSILGAT